MLDKVDLDRSFLLKEKMELLWADDKSDDFSQSSPDNNTARAITNKNGNE
jgi:hypothetical protein